jgi:hypothetical protein
MRELRFMLLVALLASGCEFFQGDDDTDFGEDTYGTETGDPTTDTGEDPPPTQGFRVFPKVMALDVPAIVTIELDGITPSSCELDDAVEGGYVCDAGVLPDGGTATIYVEKDGFDMAVRHPQVLFNQIAPLEVHLAVEGGPTGVWSECHSAGGFGSCADLCETFVSSCLATACATDDPEWPIATYQTFADAECTTLVESVPAACETPLPAEGTVPGMRCCCTG